MDLYRKLRGFALKHFKGGQLLPVEFDLLAERGDITMEDILTRVEMECLHPVDGPPLLKWLYPHVLEVAKRREQQAKLRAQQERWNRSIVAIAHMAQPKNEKEARVLEALRSGKAEVQWH